MPDGGRLRVIRRINGGVKEGINRIGLSVYGPIIHIYRWTYRAIYDIYKSESCYIYGLILSIYYNDREYYMVHIDRVNMCIKMDA